MSRFNRFHTILPLEFDNVFRFACRVSPRIVLKKLSRDSVVNLAALLNKEYCGKPAIQAVRMLSSSDRRAYVLAERIQKHVETTKSEKKAEVVVAFDNMPLEILRIAFSMKPNKMHDVDVSKLDKLQWQTVKLIAQINQKSMDFTATKEEKRDLAKLLLVNDVSYRDIFKQDTKGQFIAQPIQAILFFQLLESNPKYNSLLKAFYVRYGIESWKEYVRSVYSTALQSLNDGAGTYLRKTIEEAPLLISISVIENLSIDSQTEVIKYASEGEWDSKGNSDYRVFKGRPFFKLTNGNFVIHNPAIVIDRLFSGLYFDFQEIREELIGKQPDIGSLFTSEFVEKTLFCGTVTSCVNTDHYNSFNEEGLKKIHKIANGELGYPDYLIRHKSGKAIILFECKDIRLNAWIKEKRDYGLIERELKNKMVSKIYKIDREKKQRIEVNPTRIGIGQIAGHTANIRKGSFPWALDLRKDVIIYPVLVIADNRLIFDGLPHLAQKWYYDCLKSEGLQNTHIERPLIMMSPLTLIKYQKDFYSKGFEYYFEKYYKSITNQPNSVVDLFNNMMSFDTFMEQFPFSLDNLREDLMNTLYVEARREKV